MAIVNVIIPDGECCEGCDKLKKKEGGTGGFYPFCSLWQCWLGYKGFSDDIRVYKAVQCADGSGTLIEGVCKYG